MEAYQCLGLDSSGGLGLDSSGDLGLDSSGHLGLGGLRTLLLGTWGLVLSLGQTGAGRQFPEMKKRHSGWKCMYEMQGVHHFGKLCTMDKIKTK